MHPRSASNSNVGSGGFGGIYRDLPDETRSNYLYPQRISHGSVNSFASGLTVKSTPNNQA